LVLIDVQNEYLSTGNVALSGIDAAVENAAKVLGWARKHKLPIIHVVHVTPAGAPIFSGKGGEIVPRVAPIEGEPIVSKTKANSFSDTKLKEVLDSYKTIKHLVIVGFMTHNCVNSTVRAARDEHGYAVTVVANATGTRDLRAHAASTKVIPAQVLHEAHLSGLSDAYAQVISSPEDLPQF